MNMTLAIRNELVRMVRDDFVSTKTYTLPDGIVRNYTNSFFNVGELYNAEAGRSEDLDYPKAYVVFYSGHEEVEMSRRTLVSDFFAIIFVTKFCGGVGEASSATKILTILDEFKIFLQQYPTLNDKVNWAFIRDYNIDGGIAEPEAILSILLEVSYHNDFC